MNHKILKIITIILLLITLTMANFISVGIGLVSYAQSNSNTNHQNVEFDAHINENHQLAIQINVKKEGYFNGEIALENSNFKMKSSESGYVNKIEENKITFNQINAGTSAQIEIEIEPVTEEIIEAGLLNASTKLNLTGIYRDSTEKNINIKATREVKLEYEENNQNENLENKTEIITNKIVKVAGEEKRVVQILINMGLKENNYPIKEMTATVDIPSSDGKTPTIAHNVIFNTMTKYKYEFNGKQVTVHFTNEPNEQNKIVWKKQGNERLVLTLIYEKDADLSQEQMQTQESVILYNGKELKSSNQVAIDKEEKDSLIELQTISEENEIYKGKLYAGMERSYETKTNIMVNLAKAEDSILVKEEASQYSVNQEEVNANTIYRKTTIKKEEFDKILGAEGNITITNEKGEILAIVNSQTPVDSDNNMVVNYAGKEPSSIQIKTTTPVAEGSLSFYHQKVITAQNKEIVKQANELVTKISYEYGTGMIKTEENKIALTQTKTEATFEINKNSLSTVVENNVEIRATLKSNSEQYNLYKNPILTFTLPEEVENIKINGIDLIYETELKIKNYEINGRNITIYLEGEQTNYKDSGIEGAIVILNTNILVNRKAATKTGTISMTYQNEDVTKTTEQEIRIVAPKDMTVLHNIKELGIETMGQEEVTQASLVRGAEAKQLETEIEMINNNENTIENVKILGTFPTKNQENNIASKIIEGIQIQAVEGTKIYYTENENATNELENSENGWEETIKDGSQVKKYLIVVPKMETQESIKGTYKVEIPASLEYNQVAKQGYEVNYSNGLTQAQNQIKATTIVLQTGVGPKIETKLTSNIAGKEITSQSNVKNGEIIQYKIEIANVGSEEIKDILVQGEVPEGTALVKPQDNYEYTGASYYQELEDKIYEEKIDILKPGEVITKKYEVRVNRTVAAGTQLSSKAQVKYGDVTKESNAVQVTTQTGNIRVSVKRVTDRNVDLYEAGTVQYFAILENISNEVQEHVKVKTNLPENLTVNRLSLITGMESEDISEDDIHRVGNEDTTQIQTREIQETELIANEEDNTQIQDLEYQEELDIGTLKAGEVKVLSYDVEIGKLNQVSQIDFSVSVKNGTEEYQSNQITDNVRKAQVSLDITANTESKYVKTGDSIIYTIHVKNNGTERIEGLKIKDTIPSSLSVNKVSFDEEEILELKGENEIEISCDLAPALESTIVIETVVNYSEARIEAEPITNHAYAELLAEKIATTQEINHIIEANQTDEETNQGNHNEIVDNNIANGNKMITGMAWFDENGNGIKEDNETVLNQIKVRLLNTETGKLVKNETGNVLETTTNENGIYVLNHIGNGKYMVIFDYDTTKYALTKYKVDGTINSSVMKKEVLVENTKQEVASTDIIEVNNENISDINIGFIKLENFDLKLEKFVSKILIQNAAGTTVKEYNDATVAKAELDGKTVNGTTVIIEYKIRVSNVGEIDGYVKKIVDYMPNDLKFSSELNKDWYQTAEGIYHVGLANEKIAAGESKEVTLTLTKSMTENNVGLINNTAEIAESYNELGIEDSNSTPGNRVKGENDYGSADVLLSLKTGGIIYISIIIVIAIALGTIVVIILRKRAKNQEKEI